MLGLQFFVETSLVPGSRWLDYSAFTWINETKWQQQILLPCLHALPCKSALPCLELKVLASTVAILHHSSVMHCWSETHCNTSWEESSGSPWKYDWKTRRDSIAQQINKQNSVLYHKTTNRSPWNFFIFESRIYATQPFVLVRPVDFCVLIRKVLCSVPLEGCISLSLVNLSVSRFHDAPFMCLAPFGGLLVLQFSAANASVNSLPKLWQENLPISSHIAILQWVHIQYPTFLEILRSSILAIS